MHATTIAVDLAKSVFQVSLANKANRGIDRKRLTRSQFERFLSQHPPTFYRSELKVRISGIDRQLETIARQNDVALHLLTIPGIGVTTATAFENPADPWCALCDVAGPSVGSKDPDSLSALQHWVLAG